MFQPVHWSENERFFLVIMTKNEIKNSENQKPVQAFPDDSIANELVRARKVLGWTQNELHLRTGISRDTIKQYETGRHKPGAREICLLCDALGISPNRLLLGRDDFNPSHSPLKDIVNDPEANEAKRKFRLIVLFSMLTTEERDALLTLLEPILASRKGGEKQLREELAKFDSYDFTLTRVDSPPIKGGLREMLEKERSGEAKKSK